LDILDNGIVKDVITNTVSKVSDFVKNSISKTGKLTKAPDVYSLAGPTYDPGAEYANPTIQFVKLETWIEKRQEDVTDKAAIKSNISKTLQESVVLPFPQDVSIATSPEWSAESAGAAGAAMLNQNRDVDSNLIATASDFISNVDFAANATASALGIIGSVATGQDNLGKIYNASKGKLLNPRDVTLFQGIQHRTFDLTFNFGVQSKADAILVSKFIRNLHINALPGINGVYFDIPEYFKFSIVNGHDKPILDRGEVMITNITCNYTPDGVWATFNDGRPVHIVLSLSFMERELPTKETVSRMLGK